MGTSCLKKCNSSSASVDSYRGKYRSRFSVKTRHDTVDVHVGQGRVQVDRRLLQSSSNIGCIRLPLFGPTPKVHVLAQGSTSSGSGCFALSLGSGDLPVPSRSSPSEGDQEDKRPEGQSNSGMPTVANSTVVGVAPGHDGGTSHVAATLQNHPADSGRHSCLSLPGSSGGTACYRQEFLLSKSCHDLDEADLDFLSKHLAPQTASGYGYTFKKFRLFCEQLNADPLTCAPAVVVKYLRNLFESGAEYSTVNFHRSGISKFHVGIDGIAIGEHPLVSQAVKAVFRLRPPLPKYQSTFDIVPVLAYVQSLPTTTISLQLLTFKTLFLTIYSSISRVSSVARLGPSLQEHRDSVVLHFVSLEKQARVGNTRGYLQIPHFPEDPELCPVRALVTYFNKVTSGNNVSLKFYTSLLSGVWNSWRL